MQEKVSLEKFAAPQQREQIVVPTEALPLPSKGLTYPPEHPLSNAERLEIKSMTAKDEDILTSRALIRQGRAISMLLRSCIVDPKIDVDSMLVGDRNAALVAIRITGYGPEYRVGVVCPVCDEPSEFSFDLSKLPIKPLSARPIVLNANAFEVVLKTGRRIVFKLLTGADEDEISQTMAKTKKMLGPGAIESLVTSRLFYQTLSIGDVKDRDQLREMIDSMPARESKELRNHIADVTPGIDMKQDFKCAACGESSEVDVQISTEFFWPSR